MFEYWRLKASGSSEAIIPNPPAFIKVAVSAESIHALILFILGQAFFPKHWFFAKFCISKAKGVVGTEYVIVNFFLLNLDGKKVVLCNRSEFILALDIGACSFCKKSK